MIMKKKRVPSSNDKLTVDTKIVKNTIKIYILHNIVVLSEHGHWRLLK